MVYLQTSSPAARSLKPTSTKPTYVGYCDVFDAKSVCHRGRYWVEITFADQRQHRGLAVLPITGGTTDLAAAGRVILMLEDQRHYRGTVSRVDEDAVVLSVEGSM